MSSERRTDMSAAADLLPAPAEAAGAEVAVLSRGRRFRRRFLRDRAALVALAFLIILVVSALFAPLLAPEDPASQDLLTVLERPSADHLLGTDHLGRDVLSRLIHASRVSLLAAFEAVLVGIVLALPPGLIAGYAGGWVDSVIMRVADALMSFPPLLLAIAIVAVLGPGVTKAMFAVGVVFAPRLARLVRASVLDIRDETFIEAARSIGVSTPRILRRHILPNIMPPLLVQISILAGVAMLLEAGLSFLGLGVQPPDASWGTMLGEAFIVIYQAQWLSVFPGVAIALSVLAFNVLGDGLRDAIGREVRRAT
jgi:peptide/nickel transport system permease protein